MTLAQRSASSVAQQSASLEDRRASSVQQLGRDAVATMQAALTALRDSRGHAALPPTRQQLQAAVALLRKEAATVGLYFSQRAPPQPTEDVQPLLRNFQNAVALVCMLCTGLSAAEGQGPSLRKAVLATASALVESCAALVRGAAVDGAQGTQLMMLSGCCLEMCEVAGRAPLDNRAAVGRAITTLLKQIVDAQRELQQAVDESAQGGAAEAQGGEGSEALGPAGAAGAAARGGGAAAAAAEESGSTAVVSGLCNAVQKLAVAADESGGGREGERQPQGTDEVPAAASSPAAAEAGAPAAAEEAQPAAEAGHANGTDEEGEWLDSEQLTQARAVLGMLAGAIALVKTLVRVLLAQPAELPEGSCEGWESLLFHVRALGVAADDLAAGIYSGDGGEVESAAGAVATCSELLVDEVVPVPSEVQQAELAAALAAVEQGRASLLGSRPADIGPLDAP